MRSQNILLFVLILSFTLLLVGCRPLEKPILPEQNSTKVTDAMPKPSQTIPSEQAAKEETVTFDQSNVPVGIKFHRVDAGTFTVKESDLTMEFNGTTDLELLSADKGLFNWKKRTNLKVSGTAKGQEEEKTLDDNRIMLIKEDKQGNVISKEGEETTETSPFEYHPNFPKHPLHVKEEWQGYTINSEKEKIPNFYTLEAIAIINGKKFAVISMESEENADPYISSKEWIEVPSGIIYKGEMTLKGTIEQLDNQEAEGQVTTYLTDASGKSIIP